MNARPPCLVYTIDLLLCTQRRVFAMYLAGVRFVIQTCSWLCHQWWATLHRRFDNCGLEGWGLIWTERSSHLTWGLTLMLLAANFANAKLCKKNLNNDLNPGIRVLIWVFSESHPMNTNMTGFRWVFKHLYLGQNLVSWTKLV